jgi:hypothetical protein
MHQGGCYCGQVRYEVRGRPFYSTLCHCIDCRRIAAAPVVAWFTALAADFRFIQGEPKRFASSEKVVRSFCANCGTPLTYQHEDLPDELDVSTCSLDAPELVVPDDHTHTAEQLPWVHFSDGLKTYLRSRPE